MSALSAFTAIVVAIFAAIGDYLGSMALGAWRIVLVIGFVILAYNAPEK